MFYTYIIYSALNDKYYIGCTSNLEQRLLKHATGANRSTKYAKDWEFVYTEEFETKSEALKREKQIKNWKSRKKIEEIVARWSSGS